MAELDFSKIYGETATSKASFTDENYLNGWGYLGSTPPPYQLDELISISSKTPNLEKLKMELSIPMRDFDNNGRVKVESKKDLAKRDIKSPNIADSFIMAYAPINSGLNIRPDALKGLFP